MASIPGTRLNARPSLPGRLGKDFSGSESVPLIQFQGVQWWLRVQIIQPEGHARAVTTDRVPQMAGWRFSEQKTDSCAQKVLTLKQKEILQSVRPVKCSSRAFLSQKLAFRVFCGMCICWLLPCSGYKKRFWPFLTYLAIFFSEKQRVLVNSCRNPKLNNHHSCFWEMWVWSEFTKIKVTCSPDTPLPKNG